MYGSLHMIQSAKNVEKYQATGTSRNLNKEQCGRPKAGRSAANIQVVRNHLQQKQQQVRELNPVKMDKIGPRVMWVNE